jgi:hypothetical protein
MAAGIDLAGRLGLNQRRDEKDLSFISFNDSYCSYGGLPVDF